MSSATDAPVVSWRDYVDIRIAALEVATSLSKDSLERRLEAMNAFRNQLNDQAKTFVSKSEHTIVHEHTDEAVAELRQYMNQNQGKASQNSVLLAYGLSVVSLLVTIALLVLEYVRK